MGTKITNLMLLRIDSIHFPEDQWWKDADLLLRFLTCFENAIRAEGFFFFGKRGRVGKKFTDLKSLVANYQWGNDAYTFLSTRKEEDPWQGRLEFDPHRGVVYLVISDPIRDDGGKPALNLLISTVRDLYETLGESVSWGPDFSIELSNFSFPRARPPRRYSTQPAHPDNLVTFLPENFYLPNPEIKPESVADLRKTPLPQGIMKEQFGGLTIIRLVDDLTDPSLIRKRMMAYEDWLIDLLNPEMDDAYNEKGDYRVFMLSPKATEGVTLVDLNVAYKAVVLDSDGNLDEDIMQELRSYISQGKIPDGTKIDAFRLILPNRESAIRIHDTAIAHGIKSVVYATDDGQFWDPFPRGVREPARV